VEAASWLSGDGRQAPELLPSLHRGSQKACLAGAGIVSWKALAEGSAASLVSLDVTGCSTFGIVWTGHRDGVQYVTARRAYLPPLMACTGLEGAHQQGLGPAAAA